MKLTATVTVKSITPIPDYPNQATAECEVFGVGVSGTLSVTVARQDGGPWLHLQCEFTEGQTFDL